MLPYLISILIRWSIAPPLYRYFICFYQSARFCVCVTRKRYVCTPGGIKPWFDTAWSTNIVPRTQIKIRAFKFICLLYSLYIYHININAPQFPPVTP